MTTLEIVFAAASLALQTAAVGAIFYGIGQMRPGRRPTARNAKMPGTPKAWNRFERLSGAWISKAKRSRP